MTNLDLKILQEHCKDLYHSSPRNSLVYATLHSQMFDFESIHCFDDLLTPCEDHKNPFTIISEGYQLFSLALIKILNKNCSAPYLIWLQERIENFRQIKVWEEFQLASALKSVLSALIGESSEIPNISQLKSGAAFFEWKGLWSWGKTTHGRFHADLGFFWAMLGYLTQEPSLIEASKGIAKWQLNTLNSQGFPIRGPFNLEENGSLKSLLISNYLLFQTIAVFADDSDLSFVAAKQLDYLEPYVLEELPDSILLTNMFLNQIRKIEPSKNISLSPWIFDQETGLIGCRTAENTVLCAGNGGQTGLGYVKQEQVEIVNYGPQFLPLGDCQRFGVEGSRFQSNLPAWKMNLSESGFKIKSTVRLAPRQMHMESLPHFRNGLSSNVWVEIEQGFTMQKNILSISATFVSLDPVQELAFVFFASADSCSVEERTMLYPKTFARYHGDSHFVELKKKDSTLLLKTSLTKGKLEVIPLGGEDNFWGADFLIAYHIDPSHLLMHWDIYPVQI